MCDKTLDFPFEHALANPRDIGSLDERLSRDILRRTGLSSSFLALYRDEAAAFELVSARGRHADALWSRCRWVPTNGDAFIERILLTAEEGYLEDARRSELTNKDIVDPLGTSTIICLPLKLGRHVFGILGAGNYGLDAAKPLTPEEIEAAKALAQDAALALARVQLMQMAPSSKGGRLRTAPPVDGRESPVRLAHDLNNLLSAAMGSVEMLADEIRASSRPRELEVLREAHSRACELITEFFERQRHPKLQPYDLGRRICDMKPLLRSLLAPGVSLEVGTPEALPKVRADAGMIDRVVINLIANAGKALGSTGRVTVHVEAAEHRLGTAVRLSIADTGPGIPPELLDRVFEPYFTTRAGQGGLGLGLPTSRDLVRENGGELTIRSPEGGGTVVDVLLPAEI